ncbi:MAG: DUF502 domain-containing protein [Salinirussus sp.]
MALVDRLKTGFVAGLVLVAPLFVTIIAFQLLFSWSRGLIRPIVAATGLGAIVGDVPYLAEIMAMALLVLAITLLGYLAQRSVGAYVFGLVDRGLAKVPVFSVVYTGVRQVSDALTSQQSRFERVAMIEFPRKGLYSLGFVTGESSRAISSETGSETYNIYIPGSPNPTQGRLLHVPAEEITELDMSVSTGLRLLVTTGIAEERSEMADLADEVGNSSDAFETALEEIEGGQR